MYGNAFVFFFLGGVYEPVALVDLELSFEGF